MTRRSPLLLLISAALVLVSLGARAAVVDFEDLGTPPCTFDQLTPSFASGGFTFSGPPAGPGLDACSEAGDAFFASNDSTYIAGLSITMAEALGAAFDLTGFDVAEYLFFLAAPIMVTVEGTLAGGGSVMAMFTTDGVNDGGIGPLDDFEPFGADLSAFVGLSSVTFSAASAIGIDNLAVVVRDPPGAAPEPGPALLLGAGLLLLAGARARRRARAGI